MWLCPATSSHHLAGQLSMPSSPPIFTTPLTTLIGQFLGMNIAAGPKLAATVTNSGGIGVIGGLRQSPEMLQKSINDLKKRLENKDAPFGIDLLIPQVGGNARKTNVSQYHLW